MAQTPPRFYKIAPRVESLVSAQAFEPGQRARDNATVSHRFKHRTVPSTKRRRLGPIEPVAHGVPRLGLDAAALVAMRDPRRPAQVEHPRADFAEKGAHNDPLVFKDIFPHLCVKTGKIDLK